MKPYFRACAEIGVLRRRVEGQGGLYSESGQVEGATHGQDGDQAHKRTASDG